VGYRQLREIEAEEAIRRAAAEAEFEEERRADKRFESWRRLHDDAEQGDAEQGDADAQGAVQPRSGR
jgi:hypothetical protein